MKATIQSNEFLRERKYVSPHVNEEMLYYAKKKVTIIRRSGQWLKIKEDNGRWDWAPWMFKGKIPKMRAPLSVGSYALTIKEKGDIAVGCTDVSFKLLERIYKKALKEKNKKRKIK